MAELKNVNYESPNTKLALIFAGGELFAEHGYEGVSTRAIADKAGVNLGGIHYHFGSKEKLYLEVFRYILEKDSHSSIKQLLKNDPSCLDTPEKCANTIWNMVRNSFRDFLHGDKPKWHFRLIVREMTSATKVLPILVEEIFRPDHEDSVELYKRIKPDAPEGEAYAWAFSSSSQICFYILANDAINEMIGRDAMADEGFILSIARVTARGMILNLGLPMPEELKQ